MLSQANTRDVLSVTTAELEAGGKNVSVPLSGGADARPKTPTEITLVSEGAELPTSGRQSRYRVGSVIAGRYRLIERIGVGGAGEVWLAEHTLLNTKVAVKFCLEPSSPDSERARTALDRFRFEAQVSAQLGCKTPHIVVVHDAGRDARGPFVVMEYAPGRGLDELLRREGSLPAERVAKIVEHVADALSVAHAAGIVHRDLKPANILMVPDAEGGETAKLADFGIAKAAAHRSTALAVDAPRSTAHGVVIGTPDYLSPERARGESVDESADLWALAVLAYEALTGVTPFRRKSSGPSMLAILTSDFQAPSKRRPELPSGIDAWFKRAFHQEREKRFTCAREMSESLSRILSGRPKKRTGRRGPPTLIVSMMSLGIVVAGILVPTRLPPNDALGAVGDQSAVKENGAAQEKHSAAALDLWFNGARSQARPDRREEDDQRGRKNESGEASAAEWFASPARAGFAGEQGGDDPESERAGSRHGHVHP